MYVLCTIRLNTVRCKFATGIFQYFRFELVEKMQGPASKIPIFQADWLTIKPIVSVHVKYSRDHINYLILCCVNQNSSLK